MKPDDRMTERDEPLEHGVGLMAGAPETNPGTCDEWRAPDDRADDKCESHAARKRAGARLRSSN